MRLTFRKKALLLILPILGIVSAVYTYDAIKTEKEIVRSEIIKRAEAITALATRTGELPILSGSTELLNGAVSTLRANAEVASVAFFDSSMNLLIHDGAPISGKAPVPPPGSSASMVDDGQLFVFYAPIFTVRSAADIDILHEGNQPRQVREKIGAVRLGFSKTAMNEAVGKVVAHGLILAAVFTLGSSVAVFFLITLATRPLTALFLAVKRLEKGEFPEVENISSSDEIGELSVAFNRMSRAIKERESALTASGKRMRELFERVEHAIFRLDEKGAIIEANSKFRDLFGDVGMFNSILSGEAEALDSFRRASAGGVVHQEEKAVGRNEPELTILLSLYPAFDPRGEISGYDGYIIDITEKKRLEERLLRSQKLEAVGTLAGGMAHDFNNVLAAILGYSEMMLDEIKMGDAFYRPITTIHNAAKRGADLAMKILAITRKEKMEVRSVDLNDIVRNSIELLRRSIPKNIEIITAADEDLPRIMADPSQMQQVILNLAINARDAMADGGRLTIGVEMAEQENRSAGGPAPAGHLKLYVADTGVGMSKATQNRVFDPFFTTKEAGKGTGLGLYIVHSIVSNHGGHINLYSEQGEGTLVNVYLPVVKGVAETAPLEGEALKGSETILVIDDESAVGEMSKDMLTRLGYRVLLAGGGIEGLGMFRRMKDAISLVILDMIMPEMSGKEAFQLLKSIKPEVKVVLCSGYSQDGYAGIENLMNEGADGFIQKPFGSYDIALALRKALSKKDNPG